MKDFLVYMLIHFLSLIIFISYGSFIYVAFDVRKRLLGEPYERGMNISMKRFKREYKIADEWWRNR